MYCIWKHSSYKKPMNEEILVVIILTLTIGFSRGLNCSGDPCMYGICLENATSTYSCYCIDGYTGINCEINWDDCWSGPCLNGGTCNDAVASYNCTCIEGFVGTNCEQKYSECSNQPCLNNGTCFDYDGITCQCPDGYSGDYCEIDVSVCNDTICKNSGECVEGPGLSFFCRCPEGWTGRLCDEDLDECVTSPCKNGGLCINIPASYTCACLFGYTGKDCDKVIVPCEENPCENGAVCLLEDERPVCYCVPDYHGALCELRYDDCKSKNADCRNGGTCIDGINSFTCACPSYYTGPICDTYDLPSTTISTSEETLEVDTDDTTTASFSSSKSSLPKTSELPITTSTMPESSTFFRSTSRSYTKWYPFTETPSTVASVTSRNDTMPPVDNNTESTLFISNTSTEYSTISKDTVSLDSPTFSSISEEMPRTFSTIKMETEHVTERSFYDGSTVKEITYDDEHTGSTAAMGDTSIAETVTTMGYTSSTKYSPVTATSIEKVTDDLTTIESQRNLSTFSTITIPAGITEFWENKTTERTTIVTDVPKTSLLPFTDQLISTLTSTVTETELHSSTVPSQIVTESRFENLTTYTEYDEQLRTTHTTSSTINQPLTTLQTVIGCNGTLCTSSTVTPVQNDTECNCPQRGKDCKSDPNIIRAAFNGKSYARHRVDVNIINNNNATLQIFLRLRTRFKSGIILHVYFDDEKYALVYLELGSVKFQFSCGLDTMLLGEIDSAIDNGYEVDIDMRFQYFMKDEINKCSARLLVNDTTAISGEQILPQPGHLPQYANLHLGGIPMAFSHYFSHLAIGFIGCMDLLKVNGIARHFIYDSIETFQIDDCVSFLCLSNPCHNFGVCEEINDTVRCRCIAGYTGQLCERSACDESPCALGATCISSPGTGFVCVCPLGTHGLLCEEDTVIIRPSFSVLVPGFSSYVAYGVSGSIKDAMELKMKLIPRTLEQISLIAYLGQSGSRRDLSDHLSITYVRGYIMLTWDLGSGVRRIFTSIPLNTVTMTSSASKSYKAYTIQVGRKGRDAWLAVDGIGNVTGRVVGSMTRLDVSPILYIGGYKTKNFESLPHDLPLHTGFSGCIFDVELRTENAIYPITSSSPATGRAVSECQHSECVRHSCKNGAVCLSHGATYSCICTKEWMGFDCSTPVDVRSSTSVSSCDTMSQ